MSTPRPFDPNELETLPVVQLVSVGPPIREGQIHRAWRGMVQTPGSVEPAIPVAMKYMASPVKLAIELGCSLASAVLGLPVPRGMLVLANPADLTGLPTDARQIAGRDEVLLYGSVLRWPDDTAERALSDDASIADFLWHRFCDTKVAAPGAAWDELVANPDRHTGNFIFDGERYWLIDHDLSLRPLAEAVQRMTDAGTRQSLIEHRANDNQVARQMLNRRPNDHGMLQQPKHFESKAKALELLATRMPSWRTGITPLDTVLVDAETVVRGIILRLPALALQLNDRLSKPGGSLLWTPSNAS